MIKVEKFSKAYNNSTILTISSLLIKNGLVVFKGENGSGKSTFLKALSGIIPYQGSISINNIVASNIDLCKNFNYSFAEPVYPSFISGKDLLNYTEKIKPGSYEKLATTFNIKEWYKNPIHTYSSGMLKKISIIAAMAPENSTAILDEPFTTIDQESQQLLLELIENKVKNQQSIIIASHQDITLNVNQCLEVKNNTIVEI